jgi:hypothetical protein
MSWMDLSDYLVIEQTAAARIDDLHDEAASDVAADVPAPARPGADRVRTCDWRRPASLEMP